MGAEIKYVAAEDLVLFKTWGTYEITHDIEAVKNIIDELNTRVPCKNSVRTPWTAS